MRRREHGNFWGKLDHFPPILIRLLARHPKGKPLTTSELANRGALSAFYIEALSQLTTWDMVPLAHIKEFFRICQIDLENPAQFKRVTVYLKGKVINGQRRPPSFPYLRKDPQWETFYRPLLQTYLESLAKDQRLKSQRVSTLSESAGSTPRA